MITCDEIIDAEAKFSDKETKRVPINFNEKKAMCKTQNFYILLAFIWITITLLIAILNKALSKTKTFMTISQHK